MTVKIAAFLAFLLVPATLAGTGCAMAGSRESTVRSAAAGPRAAGAALASQQTPAVRDEAVKALADAISSYGRKGDSRFLLIDVTAQRLFLFLGTTVEASYPVSTSKFGVGSREGSNMTPPGAHRICGRYGSGAPLGTIFKARQSTRKVAKIFTDATDSEEDFVTTRVIWLTGLEPGRNSGKGCDSKKRCIYIHGTPEEGLIGRPASHGCVRMKNRDCAELFDLVFDNDMAVIVP